MDGVADIGAAYFTASHLRSTVVDFTIPLDESSLTFFLKNPKLGFSWTSFLQPFNINTWYTLILMIIICSLSLGCTACLAKEKNISEFSFEKSLIYSFGAYCAFSSRRFLKLIHILKVNICIRWSTTPVNICVRVAFITILLGGCLVFWHWKARLISNLSVEKHELPFDSVEELLKSNHKVEEFNEVLPNNFNVLTH